MKTIFINGRIVTPNAVLTNHKLVVNTGKIVEITPFDGALEEDVNYVDLKDRLLLPGLIDIHSDMIEYLLQPRSTSLMDFSMGLYEAEKQLVACGITTIFHSVAMFQTGVWGGKEIRCADNVERLAKLIRDMQKKPHLINNYHHLRYEIDNLECFNRILNLLDDGCVQLMSLMDHRPGQGQYKDLEVYKRHLPGECKSLTEEEFLQIVKSEQEKDLLTYEQMQFLVEKAKVKQIAVASHDDDILSKIDQNAELGIQISEFPITLDAAKHAHKHGMYTLLGAPNVLRGKSHSGNLSALEAIREGVGDILCSDYYPQALLRAVLVLAKQGILPLEEAIKLVTLNPAKATNIAERTGSLEVGKDADLIVVDDNSSEQVLMIEAYVQGNRVFQTQYIGG